MPPWRNGSCRIVNALNEYITGRSDVPSRRELNRLIERHEWFTTARRARAVATGDPDPALTLPMMFWPTVPPRPVVDNEPESRTQTQHDGAVNPTPDLIDRFIMHGNYRIDPAVEAREVAVDIDIDPEMVTPELAEIYRAQGLEAEAEKIYRTLNLRNS